MAEQDFWVPRPIDKIRQHKIHDILYAEHGYRSDDIMEAVRRNPSAHLPYHGTPHLYVVAMSAFRLAQMENLRFNDVRAVTLAGLFHDFDHQMAEDDSDNVAAAIRAVYDHVPISLQDEVADLIEATRYPHINEPRNRMESVLRDADILYSTILVPDAQYFRNGLNAERGTPATENESLAFIIGHGLNTRTAANDLHKFMQIGASNAQAQHGQ